jgi:Spy/CpxP family protein refolding chaperone
MFRGRGGPMGLPLGRLQLSDSQREQVQTIRQSREDELKAIGDRVHQARQALDAAIAAESFDEGLIRTRAAELAQVEADVTVVQARIRHDVFTQVLTDAQRAELKQLQDQQPRRERGPGRGQAR